MVLFTTTAVNDNDLAAALGSLSVRCPVPSDVCFWGRGENGTTLSIACERKKPGDLSQCINDGRLLHQMQTAKAEGIDVFCLIVEGTYRPSPEDGLVEVPVWGVNPKTLHRCQMWEPLKPAIAYSRLAQFLFELSRLVGVYVLRSCDVRETAAIIKSLWSWFQKPLDQHQSLKSIYKSPPPTVSLVEPSLVSRVAVELPGIGWERARAVDEHFRCVRDMANANEKEWKTVSGVGGTTAKRVVSALSGGREGGKRIVRPDG